MTKTELKVALGKMYCNYIQESGDLGDFFALALDYIENNSELDFDDDAQYKEALQIAEDAIAGRVGKMETKRTIVIEIIDTNGYTAERLEEMVVEHLANWDVEAKVIESYEEK